MYATRVSLAARALILTVATFMTTAVFADPPDHAKAYGRRKKDEARYLGYTGREWGRDYGVLEGSCNRKEIGTVVGAVVGGAIGSQIGDGSGRTVAIIVGSVLGAAIGREIGRDFDQGDRACLGHALELAREGQSVRWLNDKTGVTYEITPRGRFNSGGSCRAYKLTASRDGNSKSTDSRACRSEDGTWKRV
jgi:surface antigen